MGTVEGAQSDNLGASHAGRSGTSALALTSPTVLKFSQIYQENSKPRFQWRDQSVADGDIKFKHGKGGAHFRY